MHVAIPLFPGFTALDAVGPYEVLQRIPGLDVTFVGHRRGEVRSDNAMLGMTCDAAFDEVARPDVVVFPGGHGSRALLNDDLVLQWIRNAHAHTTFTTSVCTGSLVLAATGVSSGIDMALRLVELLVDADAAKAAQLMIEYDPQPPFDSGSLRKADAATTSRALQYFIERR